MGFTSRKNGAHARRQVRANAVVGGLACQPDLPGEPIHKRIDRSRHEEEFRRVGRRLFQPVSVHLLRAQPLEQLADRNRLVGTAHDGSRDCPLAGVRARRESETDAAFGQIHVQVKGRQQRLFVRFFSLGQVFFGFGVPERFGGGFRLRVG